MVTRSGDVIINVSPKTIYGIIIDPANLPRLLRGNLASVSDVAPLPGGGYRYRWVYRWAGLPIQAEAAMTELLPHSRIVIESSGGLRTTSTWTFEADGSRTKATFTVEAPDLSALMRRLTGRFIENQLAFAVDIALTNVKHIAEAEERAERTSAPGAS